MMAGVMQYPSGLNQSGETRTGTPAPQCGTGVLARQISENGYCFPYPHRRPARQGCPVELERLKGNYSLFMQEIGKYAFLAGIVLAIFGALAWRFPNLFQWLGKLPGDVSFQKGSFSFYFPIVTCIVISILLTIVSWLFRR